jgi:hypothetical protein
LETSQSLENRLNDLHREGGVAKAKESPRTSTGATFSESPENETDEEKPAPPASGIGNRPAEPTVKVRGHRTTWIFRNIDGSILAEYTTE